jgi:hypothetical protein
MNTIYRSLRLFTNFFLPVMQLMHKTRQRAKVTRSYDTPCSPYERILASPCITEEAKEASYRHLPSMIRSLRMNGTCGILSSPRTRTGPTSFRGKPGTGNFIRVRIDSDMRQRFLVRVGLSVRQ